MNNKSARFTYSVWVGGTEVNDYLLTYNQAKRLAKQFKESGYDDVVIEDTEVKTANSPLFDRNTVVMLLGALIVVIWGYVALITFDSSRAVLFAIGCSLPLAYWLMTFADDFLGGDL